MLHRPLPDWLNVSRETSEKLGLFADEVLRWTPAINLISKNTVSDIWQRHILDSAQIYPLAPSYAGVWVDIGSGAGFPGIVMAILGAPNVVLVESDQRKATFLRQAARKLSLDVQVLSKRIDQIDPLRAEIITARALAALTDLLGHANTHMSPHGSAIFPKGRGLQQEIAVAQQDWSFDYHQVLSKTDHEATLLIIKNIEKR